MMTETPETNTPPVAADRLAGLLAQWARLTPSEVRMFDQEERAHFDGEIACIPWPDESCYHHIEGDPDEADRALLLWHVLRRCRGRGWDARLMSYPPAGGRANTHAVVALWLGRDPATGEPRVRLHHGDDECSATAMVMAYLGALKKQG